MRINKYKEIMAYLKEVIDGSIFAGHVFAVGGCERDKRLGNTIKDIDLVVDIPNGGIMFANWLYENDLTVWAPVVYEHFGTAMFTLKKFPDIELETVQTRKEAYRDIESRNPETAYGTIMEDCTRRDFTVNAFYYDISNDKELDLNGKSEQDLEDKIIRTCGDPEIIFNEDPLRILRMVRFAARLGFDIEDETFDCAKKYVDRLSIISRERIHDEFIKMCEVKYYLQFRDAMSVLWDLGAFSYILPYLEKKHMKDCFSVLDDFYEMYAVNGYNVSVEEIFAYLLYGCPDAEEEMRELKCDNEFIRNVMFYINTAEKYVKAFEREDYSENETIYFRRMMNICGDSRKLHFILSIDTELRDYFFDTDFEEDTTFKEIERGNIGYYTYKLPVDGNDVMEVLGIGPSKEVKEALDRLWMFAFINPEYTDRENLMNYLKQVIKNDK